jgi:hypothetical protein
VAPPTYKAESESWRRISPERMALVASVIVVLASFGVASTLGASQGDTPRPSAAQGSPVPTGGVAAATRNPFASTATLALQITDRLAEDQHVLQVEVAATDFDISAVVGTVRRLNATARLGSDASEKLSGIASSSELGTALVEFYRAVTVAADNTLGTSVADTTEYRAGSKRLLTALEPTASFQLRLVALIASAQEPSGVAPSLTPRPSTPPASATTPATTPKPTAPPTSSPTAPSGAVTSSVPPLVGTVLNPGFEATDPRPWALTVESPAVATMTLDSAAVPFEGAQSARIDIAVPSDARTGVALRQAGIEVAQSHLYTCSVAVRAAAGREVRIRVASSSGATYGTRVVTVGSVWTVVEFEFSSFVEDPSAVIEIDLGRSATTTWIDAVRLKDESATLP